MACKKAQRAKKADSSGYYYIQFPPNCKNMLPIRLIAQK